MLMNLGHFLNVAAVLGLSSLAANAEGLGYLDGNAFGNPQLCAAMAAGPTDQALAEHGGYILAGPPQGVAFLASDFPAVCAIENVVTALPFGRGSGLNTVMVAVSCIDDVAVPEFELLALEFEGGEATGTGRVNVFPVGEPGEWGAQLVGEYVSCEPGPRATLVEMFAQ